MLVKDLLNNISSNIIATKAKIVAVIRKDGFSLVSPEMLGLWCVIEKPGGFLDVRNAELGIDENEVVLDLVFGSYDGAYAYACEPAEEFDKEYDIIEL